MKPWMSMAVVACVLTASCGDDNPAAPSPGDAVVVFSALLSPAEEVPAVTNAESSARGATQITLQLTRDAAGQISSASANFYFQLTGLPGGTRIVGAHIHPGRAGTVGPVIVNTGLSATAPLLMPGSGTVEFTVSGIAVAAATAQAIVNDPAAFYFNVHTPLNPGGVGRGQLRQVR